MARFLARFIGRFGACRRAPSALLRFAPAQVLTQRRRQTRVTAGLLSGLVLVLALIFALARHAGIYASVLSFRKPPHRQVVSQTRPIALRHRKPYGSFRRIRAAPISVAHFHAAVAQW